MISPRFLTIGLIAATLALTGCRTTALRNIQDEPFAASAVANPAPLTLGKIERSIVRVGANRGWTFERIGPGHLIGKVNVRGKHFAEVDVFFDRERFSILHKSSRNLNYDAATNVIHPNYNAWIGNLEKDIQKEIQLARAS